MKMMIKKCFKSSLLDISSSAGVGAAVRGLQLLNAQADVAKVEDGGDATAGRKWVPIDGPLDGEVLIADWLQTSFQVDGVVLRLGAASKGLQKAGHLSSGRLLQLGATLAAGFQLANRFDAHLVGGTRVQAGSAQTADGAEAAVFATRES